MHVIRLRAPWTTTREVESGVLVYARKFHRPTGVAEKVVELCVALLPHELPCGFELAVVLNGCPVPAADRTADEIRFALAGMLAFNLLELRVDAPELAPGLAPVLGSYGIRSVELQIE